tara:strand:- start:1389 stop:1916 length:528 start_codon:yes stop_codon:yes gene_type:complete
MKSLFKQKIVNVVFKLLFFLRGIKDSKNIYVYDIDNTIAKTHEFPGYNGILDKKNVLQLDYHKKIRSKIISNYEKKDVVFFFSVRPLYLWKKTFFWLKNIGIDLKLTELFFFQSPKHKVDLIKYLCDKGYKIVFYDDMSYNHENNKVLFYQNEIDILKKMPIEFFDYNFLKKYNK